MWEDQNLSKKTTFTLIDKRDLMWNFTEPGDPYDIRKSMIAKLPGDQKFMGHNLELVCLLQAAEIERLCQFLEEFKMRFRQNERVGLDRHSYEIQIKELTEKLSQQQISKTEIEKLRQFIRRQSIEVEELQRQKNNIELSRNYEQSLRQIAQLKQINSQLNIDIRTYQNNKRISQELFIKFQAERQQAKLKILQQEQQVSKLKQDLIKIQAEFNSLQSEYEVLQRNNERSSIELGKIEQLNHTIKQYENRFQILAEEIDRLNGVLRDKSRQLTQQYARGRQLSSSIEQKEEELSEKQQVVNELKESNYKLQRERRQILVSLSDLEQTKSLTQSYQSSLEKLSIEVDRLNNVLRKKLNQLQEGRRKNNDYQIKLKSLEAVEKENNEYKIRYGEVNKKISDYERELAKAMEEIQRLNYSIKKLIRQLNQYQIKFGNYQKEIQNLQKTIDILSLEINNEREAKRKLSEQLSAALLQNQTLQFTISKNEESRKIYDSKAGQYISEINKLNVELKNKEMMVQSVKSSKSQTELRIRQVQSINQNDQQYIEQLIGKNKILFDENEKLKIALQNLQKESSKPAQLSQGKKIMSEATSIGRRWLGAGSNTSIIDQNQLISKQYQQISRLNDLLNDMEKERKYLLQLNSQISTLKQKQFFNNQTITQRSPASLSQMRGRQLEEDREMKIRRQGQQIQGLQICLINKEQTMRYYVSDNEKYYTQNAQLKNSIFQREMRIERLENELNKLKVFMCQKSNLTSEKQESQNENVRLQIDYEILKERHEILQHQNQTNILRVRNLQEEIIKLQYKLTQTLRSISNDSPTRSQFSEQDKFELLKERCDFLMEEIQKYKEKLKKKQGQNERLAQRLIQTEEISLEQKNYLSSIRSFKPKQKIQNYREQYEGLLEKYNVLLFHIQQLQQQIQQLHDSSNKEQLKKIEQSSIREPENIEIAKKNEQIADYYNKILLFNSQFERLNNTLLAKEKESKEKQLILSQSKLKIEASQAMILDLNIQLQTINQQIAVLTPQNIQFARNNQLLKKNLMMLQQENKQIKAKQLRYQENKFIESKMAIFQKEIIRLNGILETKILEIKGLQQNNLKVRIQLDQQRLRKHQPTSEMKVALLSQQIERLSSLITFNDQKYQQINSDYRRDKADSLNRISQQLNKIHSYQQQIFALNSQLRNKETSQRTVNFSEFQGKMIELGKQIERLNNIILSDRQKLQQLQKKQAQYLAQIQRLNKCLQLKIQEQLLLEGKQKFYQQEKQAFQRQFKEQIQALKRKVSNSKRDYDLIYQKYQQIEQQNNVSKQHLLEYQIKIKELYGEFQRLQQIIIGLRRQNQQTDNIKELIQKNRFLGSQLQRLNSIIQKQNQDLSDLRTIFVDDGSLQRRINEDLALFVVLFAQIQCLRERLRSKQSEMEEVRKENINARLVG